MKHTATEMQKGGVPLGSENLSHLVFNPCVDFTQLNAWHNPDINRLFWEYTQTHTHLTAETGYWYLRIKRGGHNVLMKWEVGPTWLSAELKLAEHQGTIITPLTHTPTHKELWGMRLKHMGNGYMGHTSTLAVIISWGCVHTHTQTHTCVYDQQNTKTNGWNTSGSLF